MNSTARTEGATPKVRVDALALTLVHGDLEHTRFELSPEAPVTALDPAALPLFTSGYKPTLVLRAQGQANAGFEAQMELGGARVGPVVRAQWDPVTGDFQLELGVALAELPPSALDTSAPVRLKLVLAPGLRALALTPVRWVPLQGPPPGFADFDLREATDAALCDLPERKLFDLQNPEEGFWLGTGLWRLRLAILWSRAKAEGWQLELRPEELLHNYKKQGNAGDLLYEDVSLRAGEGSTSAELFLDTSHPELRGRVPPQGMDLPVHLTGVHTLRAGKDRWHFLWQRDVPLRLRDPAPQLGAFKRLSAVGIDFGTTATVAAFTHRGFRALMRLGSPPEGINAAENPTCLLLEDHQGLWAALANAGEDKPEGRKRYPNLVGLVRAAHSAREALAHSPSAVVEGLKSLPERVILLDQSPQLRDRKKHSDFLLDEARVRALVRAYAYVLGRAINRPGQDVFLHYWLTYPAEFDERARALLEEELRAGILLSIPEGIAAADVQVEMKATEPEAYAAEVCPELVNHPAIEALVSRLGELRFAVFDFGGGTLDLACGRYRPATEAEFAQSGCSSVIETLQVAGNDHLGGDYLTHELAWHAHQHDSALPELEAAEVPMQRPQTVPENKLARKAHLYKRSLAARQNRIRIERELGLEPLKFKRENRVRPCPSLELARLDGTEVKVGCFASPPEELHGRLTEHLEGRIEEGARLLASMLKSTPWGGTGDWREKGVLLLLAGNSSRGEYVARALGRALGLPDVPVWRPEDAGEPQGVVLFEMPTRKERGVEVLGISPKTAVALGALKIANREVHLVRAQQGFSYFVGDMRGFPPRFQALVPMGTLPGNADEWGPHYVEFGPWDAQKPLRVCAEFEPGKMSSNDPRLRTIATGLPPGSSGKLYVCVTAPTRIALHLALPDGTSSVRAELNLAPFMS